MVMSVGRRVGEARGRARGESGEVEGRAYCAVDSGPQVGWKV